MLDASETQLAQASAEERRTAETFAATYMITQMEQDLIPPEEARRMVAEHREGGTKEWIRAVHASMVGLRALRT